MRTLPARGALRGALFLCLTLGGLWPTLVWAQPGWGAPTTPTAQRNALNGMKAEVKWFQNTTRTAPGYGTQGLGNAWGTFQSMRQAYSALKATLNPEQQAKGANALAELEAGLDILQEAFRNYEEDVAAGRNARTALQTMCEVLRQGSEVWLDELNKTSSRLRVGR